ncbi:hypothetical protein [Desulfuromonas sp. TF]|uniref:hypothetical protein n=1 Tax=Desulfuromonas sp. TF TaxID=1232410 RepID=UPI00041D2F01|nr:hypothetical protein [Desulfuromonas sp. TF]
MTVLAQDRNTQRRDGILVALLVITNDIIYGGSLVAVNAAGYALPGGDTAGLIFQGVADGRADNTGGADGAKSVIVRRRGEFRFASASNLTQANVGDAVFLEDDQTVALAGDVDQDIYCGVITEVVGANDCWVDITPALQQTDVATHIADVAGAHAATAISLADAGELTAQATVEAAIAELLATRPVLIADPGDAGAIPVTRSGNVAITTGAAGETRTLAIPGAAGIELAISHDVDDGGDCVITVAEAVNETGNNTITLDDAGETIVLTAVQVAGALVWRVTGNDGATLSTVGG